MTAKIINLEAWRIAHPARQRPEGRAMTAKIINLEAWRIAHPAPLRLYAEQLRIITLPLRLWLAWWGIR